MPRAIFLGDADFPKESAPTNVVPIWQPNKTEPPTFTGIEFSHALLFVAMNKEEEFDVYPLQRVPRHMEHIREMLEDAKGIHGFNGPISVVYALYRYPEPPTKVLSIALRFYEWSEADGNWKVWDMSVSPNGDAGVN